MSSIVGRPKKYGNLSYTPPGENINKDVDLVMDLQKSYVNKGDNVMDLPQKETKLVMRSVSVNPDPSAGTFPVYEIDGYLSGLLAEGWQIFATHYVGKDERGWGFAWILVR